MSAIPFAYGSYPTVVLRKSILKSLKASLTVPDLDNARIRCDSVDFEASHLLDRFTASSRAQGDRAFLHSWFCPTIVCCVSRKQCGFLHPCLQTSSTCLSLCSTQRNVDNHFLGSYTSRRHGSCLRRMSMACSCWLSSTCCK